MQVHYYILITYFYYSNLNTTDLTGYGWLITELGMTL